MFDAYTHYPYDGGVIDENTNCRVFFHAHREDEYGHFHTFCEDENGDLVHIIMISMNEKGEPQMLSTVNTWVTGDKYVKADKLKKYLNNFYIDPNSYKKEKRLIQFVNNILSSYKDTCYELFEERDRWVKDYGFTNYREPFEDRQFEVLSYKKIDVFTDLN